MAPRTAAEWAVEATRGVPEAVYMCASALGYEDWAAQAAERLGDRCVNLTPDQALRKIIGAAASCRSNWTRGEESRRKREAVYSDKVQEPEVADDPEEIAREIAASLPPPLRGPGAMYLMSALEETPEKSMQLTTEKYPDVQMDVLMKEVKRAYVRLYG